MSCSKYLITIMKDIPRTRCAH